MGITQLLEDFADYLPLDEQEAKELEPRLIERSLKRRQMILQAGEVCKHYFYIVEGCLRMYKLDSKGDEHNLQLSVEGGWIADIGSFHSEEPSQLYIETLEQSKILQIARPDLLYLYTTFPKFDRIFRVMVEDAFVMLQKRVLHNISSTAEERYLDFLVTHSRLVNRISNIQIASYIGVTPEYLSNLQKSISLR